MSTISASEFNQNDLNKDDSLVNVRLCFVTELVSTLDEMIQKLTNSKKGKGFWMESKNNFFKFKGFEKEIELAQKIKESRLNSSATKSVNSNSMNIKKNNRNKNKKGNCLSTSSRGEDSNDLRYQKNLQTPNLNGPIQQTLFNFIGTDKTKANSSILGNLMFFVNYF